MMSEKNRPTSQEYAMILENIEDAVIALDPQGRISLFNPAAQTYTGLSEKQTRGQSFFTRFSHQKTLCYLTQTALESGRSISDHEAVVLRMPGSRPRPVSVTVSPIYTSSGLQKGVVLILRDLTQIRTLEEAVRRADRLSMVGTMAAGLAHEIKNPLGGIKGAAQLLLLELGSGHELQEYVELMIRETERVNGIIEELLNLSRPRRSQPGEVNLGQILDEIVMLQQQAFTGNNVNFRLQLDPSIPPLSGDRDLMIRLFLNLIKNAAEATTEGGEIIIESRIDSEYHMSVPGARPTQMVMVMVSDNGPGIPQPQLEQIFTPFFSTKEGGSGLGLPICQKIVSDHGGFMHVENRPTGGALVKVSLPLLLHPDQQPSHE